MTESVGDISQNVEEKAPDRILQLEQHILVYLYVEASCFTITDI